jgi:hypothetical protein
MNAMAGWNLKVDLRGVVSSIPLDTMMQSLVSGSHHAPTDIRSYPSMRGNLQSSHSGVDSDDSASVMDDDAVSALEGYPHHKGSALPGSAPIPVDDGTYVFKSRTPSGRTHHFQSRHDDVEHLRVHQTPSPLVTPTPSSSIIVVGQNNNLKQRV